jgi:soluble lytic murein transglycosylase-like protein
MPRLPTEQDLGQRPVPRPPSGVASYKGATGLEGAGAQGLTNVGNELGKASSIFAKYQDEIDDTNAKDIYLTQFEPAARAIFNEYKETSGKKAVDGLPVYTQKLTELGAKVSAGLNPQQKKMVDYYVKTHVSSRLNSMSDWATKNKVLWQDGVYKAELNAGQTAVSEDPFNPDTLSKVIADSAASIAAYNEKNGFSERTPQDVKGYIQSVVSSQILAQRVDPMKALETFQRNAVQLSPEQRYKFSEMLFNDAKPILATEMARSPSLALTAANESDARILASFAQERLGKSVRVDIEEPKTTFDRLSLDQKIKVMDASHTIMGQDSSQYKAELRAQFSDASTVLRTGNTPANIPTLDQLTSAFGPDIGRRMAEKLEGDRRYGIKKQSLFAKPRGEIEEIIRNESTPRTINAPGSLSDLTKSYTPIVNKYAEKYGVNPHIILAQIQKESLGNPDAVSAAGAEGVSQFIKSTAKQYNVDVKNVDSSIDGEFRFMVDLLKLFNGDYEKALAGYNFGPGNLQKTIDKAEAAGNGDNWLAFTPDETQDYVKTIMGNVGGNVVSADQLRNVKELTAAAQEILKAREADPAAFVLAPPTSPVRGAYSEMAQAKDMPSLQRASVRYARQTIIEQERLGVSNPRILTKPMVDEFISKLNPTDPNKENAAEVASSYLIQQQQRWGGSWPSVYRELVNGKAISGVQMVAARLDKPDQNLTSKTLIRASLLGEKTLKQQIEKSKEQGFDKRLDTEVFNATNPYRPALIRQGGDEQLQAHSQAAKLLALYYMSREDISVKDSVTKAFANVMGKEYHAGKDYLVPIDVDPGDVGYGARVVVWNIEDYRLALWSRIKA